ncbi:hypothetical protein PoB_005679600 [Plakobranchus ocellatus]|uniref:Uncharacterized protein n=1 Tax=Plakobranchus ocellatus TaxID=259542 RepID=A0AAV4CC17_9GAST|nr:hypothetical protein PoB_005679600 [Plakobranchus ocellatus]
MSYSGVADSLQSEIMDGILQLARKKAASVVINYAIRRAGRSREDEGSPNADSEMWDRRSKNRFGKVEGARDPEDSDMSVMVVAAMTRAQILHEMANRPLGVPTVESHRGVDGEQLFSLQQKDPAIQALGGIMKTTWSGKKSIFFEKIKDILKIQVSWKK